MHQKPSDSNLFSPTSQQLDVNVEMVLDENKGFKTCSTCKKVFKLQFTYTRHLCSCKSTVMECSICDFKFTNGEKLREHIVDHHEGKFGAVPHLTVLLTSVQKKEKFIMRVLILRKN